MIHEQHFAFGLIVWLATRFGPSNRIARDLRGWLERPTDVDCPERPRTRPNAQWRNKVRAVAPKRGLLCFAVQILRRKTFDAKEGKAQAG